MSDYEDVDYTVEGTTAVITINRPERYNAFRGRTVEELIRAFRAAWADRARAGGDPHRRGREGVLHRRRRQAARRDRRLRPHRERHVRDRLPAQADPGHPQAGDRRRQRRRGRRRARAARAVRPVDRRRRPRGSARPARRSARSTPASARPTSPGSSARSGPGRCGTCAASTTPRPPSAGAWSTRSSRPTELMDEAKAWAAEIGEKSPTALRFLKQSFNADTDHQAGPVQPRDVRAGPVRRLARGHGGRRRVRREAPAGLRRARRPTDRPLSHGLRTHRRRRLEFRDRARGRRREAGARTTRPARRAGRIDPELRREIGAAGLIAPELPVELGGQGADRLTAGIVTEEIGRGDINVAYLQVVGSLVGQILAANAAPERRRALGAEDLQRRGDRRHRADRAARRLGRRDAAPARPCATGTTGCSTAASRCRSAATPPPWSSSPAPGRRSAAARTSAPSSCRWTCPASPASRYPDMGTKAVGRGLAHLRRPDPADHLLGAEGAGFTQVMQGFDFSRALIGLQCLGTAQQTVDETWEYVVAARGVRPAADQRTRASRSRWPRPRRCSPRPGCCATARCGSRTPGSRTPPRPPCASGGRRRSPTTSSTSACCCTASSATAPSCRSSSACATCSACRSATAPRRS